MSTQELSLLSTDEVGGILKKSATEVRRMIARGEIGAYRVGGPRSELRISSSDLAAYLEARRIRVETR